MTIQIQEACRISYKLDQKMTILKYYKDNIKNIE